MLAPAEQFLENAQRLMAAAEGARDAGAEAESLTVAIGRDGAIRMLENTDWPLDRVASFHTAVMVYRVEQQGRDIVLEGRAPGRTCVLRSEGKRFSPSGPGSDSQARGALYWTDWPGRRS